MILKASFRRILLNILLVVLFTFIVLIIDDPETKTILIVIAVILSFYLLKLIVGKRPIIVKIDHSILIITFNQFLVHNTQSSEEIKELTQSYKKEIGPRGLKRMVYKIYKGNQVILEVIPNYNGWSTNKILTLKDNLQKLGVILID